MKEPVETIVDRAVAREVCLRGGGIKAFGRVEKTSNGFVITTELVVSDPDSGTRTP